MSQLHGPASLPPFLAATSANGHVQPPQPRSDDGASTRRQVVMVKSAGDRTFGMTLEPGRVMPEFPQVSYVFPNSIANRSGIRSGWTIERINGISVEGHSIQDAANLFRNLQQVVLDVDTRTESMTPSMLPALGELSSAPLSQQPGPMASASAAAATLLSSAPSLSTLEDSATSLSLASATDSYSTTPSMTSIIPSPTPTATSTAPSVPTTTAPPQTTEVPTAVAAISVATPFLPATSSSPASDLQSSSAVDPPVALPLSTTSLVAAPDLTMSQGESMSSENNSTPESTPPSTAIDQNGSPGRKRSRSHSDPDQNHAPPPAAAVAAPSETQQTGSRRRGRQVRRRSSTPLVDIWESEDTLIFCDSSGDIEVVSPHASSTSNRSRRSSRQAESGGRARRSLTVTRLMDMGFTQEDAELSVEACGQDPERCMVWIVSHLEEKQFMNDLNRASIESENQKRIEAQEQKKQESETLRQATAFTSLFQTSYILSSHAEAPRLKAMLSSTIGEIAADTLMRTIITKLLTVESKAIRWYKEASRCYMLELAARLEAAYQSHDVITCCSRVMATEPATNACSFVRLLLDEEKELTKALFFLPENHGGVPLVFLRADESMQFSLDDDGFEVVDPVLPPTSPGHE